MAKYSVPGINFTEIDNTIRSNSLPGLGIGAIVMKSNKGPVNQRVLTTSYDNFTDIYGQPENLDDYGHFAAENYLAISNQLLTVRTTMGDEGYAQIQFPYTDADLKDTYLSKDTSEFKFIDNEDNANLKLLGNLNDVTQVSALTTNDEWLPLNPNLSAAFGVYQKAGHATIVDLINDNPPSVAIFKNVGNGEIEGGNIETGSGQYVKFATKVNAKGDVGKWYDDLIFTESAWSGTLPVSSMQVSNTALQYAITGDIPASGNILKGFKVLFSIPAEYTLNNEGTTLTAYYKEDSKVITDYLNSAVSSIEIKDLFNNEYFYKGSKDASANPAVVPDPKTGELVPYEEPIYSEDAEEAVQIKFRDWDDCVNKTYYVLKKDFEDSVGQSVGIQYREYGMNTLQEALASIYKNALPSKYTGEASTTFNIEFTDLSTLASKEGGFAIINELADTYGCDPSELLTDNKYGLLTYYDVWEGIDYDYSYDEDGNAVPIAIKNEPIRKVIYKKDWEEFIAKHPAGYDERLFWTVGEKNAKTPITISVYTADEPNGVVIPWQESTKKDEEGSEPINKMAAFATSEILNGTNERYKDGYTISIESDDEPGNGDVEQYVSNKNNQLIIASIGPGEYGNDIGVSIITSECAEIPALNHQNAFNWKYRYDDEDQVDNDEVDQDTLTWKKVYRINVYVKTKSQTAEAAWGTGMDALLKDPAESWYVSNDPTAKDAEGNSLYAPNVINGHSDYIYVSRNSVNEAKTGAGTYAQPHQTYAIYGLTGGSNSKKNNVTEKIAGLKLYKDRQKADFDILFNVEAIDTFNGKQRYNALQRKIAEIAASRTIDIGVVQVTSREAKSVKRMIGEAKMFSFNNGTYVAEYAGYDKYYNGTLASWIYLPKSIAGACRMAYCDMTSYPWFAPAGVQRGNITYTNGPLTRLTDDEIGQLYDINVNTSRDCAGFGECLYGQKTALKKESALNRINVRRCLNYIEKSLETMMLPYLFQQNTANTRSAARNSIDAFLNRIQAADGVEEYALSVTQDAEDPHIMNVAIRIVPAEAIEYIDIKITVDRNTGVIARESM
jgi:phage tail sheath protein FI